MATGQAINLNKSGIHFCRDCPQSLRDNMANQLRVPELTQLGKYLGIPSEWGRTKKQMFSWIIGRVNSKLDGWKEKLISKAGKEILIKSVVQALPQYAMSIFKIPLSICRLIESKIADFWWRSNDSRSGIHWRRWEILKKRKAMGGMGFRDLIIFNKAMLSKQAWRMAQNPDALWCRFFKGVYFPHQSFWTVNRCSNASWGWQSLKLGRDNISPSVMWAVGNGEQIKIREDKWLRRGILGGPANRHDPQTVAEIINWQNNSWNEPLLRQLFEDETVTEILTIPVNSSAELDHIVWTGAPSGKYSVKFGYHNLCEADSDPRQQQASSSYQPQPSFWNRLWTMSLPPRVVLFLWSVCQNAIATRENLHKRGIILEPICAICHVEFESIEHLFLLCPWTRSVWNHPTINIQIHEQGLTKMELWISQQISNVAHPIKLELIASLLWAIWKERNNVVFRSLRPVPRKAIEAAVHMVNTASLSSHPQQHRANTSSFHSAQIWKLPQQGTMKVNFDGSIIPGDSEGSVAAVCRDFSGVIVDGVAKTLPASSPLQIEALALLWSLRYFLPRITEPLFFEGDNFELIAAVNARRPDQVRWEVSPILIECLSLLNQFPGAHVAHCKREANSVADWTAKAQRRKALPLNWIQHPPLVLRDLACIDTLHASSCTDGC